MFWFRRCGQHATIFCIKHNENNQSALYQGFWWMFFCTVVKEEAEKDAETHEKGVRLEWIIDDFCCLPAVNFCSFSSLPVYVCERTIIHLKAPASSSEHLPCWSRHWISTSFIGAFIQPTCTVKCLQTRTIVERSSLQRSMRHHTPPYLPCSCCNIFGALCLLTFWLYHTTFLKFLSTHILKYIKTYRND